MRELIDSVEQIQLNSGLGLMSDDDNDHRKDSV